MHQYYFTKILKSSEEVVRIVRRYGLTFLPQGALGVAFLLLPFFLLFPLFRWGGWGILIFCLLVLVAIFYILRQLVIWYYNVFLLTNQRIIDIDQRGFFSRTISEAGYEKIQDITSRVKGPFQTLLGYGTVEIQTAGAKEQIAIEKVYNPQAVRDLIAAQQQRSQETLNEDEPTGADYQRVINRLREYLGEKRFQEIIGEDWKLLRSKE